MKSKAAALLGLALLASAPVASGATGTCDVSPGDHTAYTGTDTALDTAPLTSPGVSEARCMKTIRTLGGFVVEGVFKDGKGRYADELPVFGKLVNMWPGETPNTTYLGGPIDKPSRSSTSVGSVYTTS